MWELRGGNVGIRERERVLECVVWEYGSVIMWECGVWECLNVIVCSV